MARVLGIDLGAWAVKVAVLEGSFGRYSLAAVHSRRVPAEPGQVPSLAQRLEALTTLVEEEELQGFGAVASAWRADRSSLRVVSLPFDDRAKVARTLPFEVENYVPFEIEDMVLEHRVIQREDGRCRVLSCLADREEIRAQLEGLQALGLDPRHLALDADIQGTWGSQDEEGVRAVVDIGHSRSLVTLVVGGVVFDARAVVHGGRHLDKTLSTTFDISPEQAEAYRRAAVLGESPDTAVPVEVGWESDEATVPATAMPSSPEDLPLAQKAGPPDPVALARVLREALLELVADLRTTLINFEDRHRLEIEELLLTGGVGATRGLPSLLSHELGVPVRLVTVPEPARGLPEDNGFAQAWALGRRAAGAVRGQPLELRQGELAHHSGLAVLRNLASYGAAAAVFFVVAMAAVALTQRNAVSAEIDSVEEQIAQVVAEVFPEIDPGRLEDPSMAVAIMQEGTIGTAQKVEALKAAIRGEPPSLTLLKEISESMPRPEDATIDVRQLTLSEKVITIEAETDGFEAAAKIEASLQNNARFESATKGDEKKRGDKVLFDISIPLVSQEQQEES
jgi:Tfp pilus assembly PilM family ATPase